MTVKSGSARLGLSLIKVRSLGSAFFVGHGEIGRSDSSE